MYEISALIVSIALAVLVIVLIPTIVHLQRSMKKVGDMAENLDNHLPAIMQNVEKISTDLSQLLSTGREHVDTLGGAVNQVKTMVDNLSSAETKFRQVEKPLFQSINTFTAVMRAAQAFMNVYHRRSAKKSGRKKSTAKVESD